MVNISIRPGRYIHDHLRKVGTVSGSWTQLGPDALNSMPTKVIAVFWEGPTSGAYLSLKDATNHVFYTHYHSSGSMNYLTQPLTLYPPIQYYDSEGNNTLALYGQFS